MSLVRYAVGVAAAIACSSSAYGQAAGSGHGSSATPSGLTLPVSKKATIELSASSDEKNATLSATANIGSGGDGNDWSSSWFVSASAQSPLGQGSDYTNVATLDGLAKSTALEFKLLLVAVDLKAGPIDTSSVTYRKTCQGLYDEGVQELKTLDLADPYPGKFCFGKRNVQAEINTLKSTNADLRRKVASSTESADVKKQKLDEIAKRDAFIESLQTRLNDLQRGSDYTLNDLWIVQGHGKVGYENHKFFDVDTLKADSISEKTFDFGIDVTKSLFGNSASANVSFRYQRSFDDGTDGKTDTQCKDDGSGALKCASGFIGAPTQKDKALIGLDVRYIGNAFNLIPFGLDPGFTYDAKSKEKAFQFPLYLVTGASGLSGGIRYDWTSAKHESVIGVFASSAFNIDHL